jgi:molecular chaperone DnaK (HSP70)
VCFEVLATHGNNKLWAEIDFDQRVMDYLADILKKKTELI